MTPLVVFFFTSSFVLTYQSSFTIARTRHNDIFYIRQFSNFFMLRFHSKTSIWNLYWFHLVYEVDLVYLLSSPNFDFYVVQCCRVYKFPVVVVDCLLTTVTFNISCILDGTYFELLNELEDGWFVIGCNTYFVLHVKSQRGNRSFWQFWRLMKTMTYISTIFLSELLLKRYVS